MVKKIYAVHLFVMIYAFVAHAQEVKTYHALALGSLDISANKPIQKGDTIFEFSLFGYTHPKFNGDRASRVAQLIEQIAYPSRATGVDALSLSGFYSESNFKAIFNKISKERHYKYLLSPTDEDGHIANAFIYNSNLVSVYNSNSYSFGVKFSRTDSRNLEINRVDIVAEHDSFTIFSMFSPYNIYVDSIKRIVQKAFVQKQVEILDSFFKQNPNAKYTIVSNFEYPRELPYALINFEQVTPRFLSTAKPRINAKTGQVIIPSPSDTSNKYKATNPDIRTNITSRYFCYNTITKARNTFFDFPNNDPTNKKFNLIWMSALMYDLGDKFYNPFKFYAENKNEEDVFIENYKKEMEKLKRKEYTMPKCVDCGNRHASYVILLKDVGLNGN